MARKRTAVLVQGKRFVQWTTWDRIVDIFFGVIGCFTVFSLTLWFWSNEVVHYVCSYW